MSLGEYLVGFAFFAATLSGVAITTWRVWSAWLRNLNGSSLAVGISVVATAILVAVHLLPGVFGILGREAVAVFSLSLAVASSLLLHAGRNDAEADVSQNKAERESRVSSALAACAVAPLAVYVVAGVASQAAVPVSSIDALTFHLPGLGRWMQSGTLWQVDNFVPQIATGNYPQNGNLVELAAVLPWGTDFLYRVAHAPFLVIFAVSSYAIGRELGAPRATSASIASVLSAMPIVFFPAVFSSIPDVIMLATLSAGFLFLLREWRCERWSDLILAGLGLGLAFGTKWYGVTTVAVVVVIWLGVSLGARRRAVIKRAAVLIGCITLAGGFWLLRNLVESGNPVYPAKLSLGITTFDAPPDPRGDAISSIADYAGEPGIWTDYILPAFGNAFGIAAAVLGLAAILVLGLGMQRRRGSEVRTGVVLGASAIVLALVYAVTPSTAPGPPGQPIDIESNARYLVPAFIVAAGCLALLVARFPRARMPAELVLLACLADAMLRGTWPARSTAVAAVVVVLLVVIGIRSRSVWRSPLRRSSFAMSTVVGVLIVGAVGAGYVLQDRFRDTGYGGLATVDRLLSEAPEGVNVGITGAYGVEIKSPVRAAFGPDFGNEVSPVGYEAEGEIRAFTSRQPFIEAVRETGYDYLLVGRGFEAAADQVREERWARSAGFEEIARDERLTLFSKSGG